VILFAGGTGILPYLDLLDFLLRKAVHEALKKRYGITIANLIDFHHENLGNTFNNVRFEMYCSF